MTKKKKGSGSGHEAGSISLKALAMVPVLAMNPVLVLSGIKTRPQRWGDSRNKSVSD